jgi:gamma-glutamylcyclotransferase (GGCT)/AIG2-like uncharacterized protein YtfP
MSSRVHHLFVYGSLRSGFKSPAYDYISRFFTLVGEAKARGQLYDMGEFPAAVPNDSGHYIIGELYKIKDEKEFSWAMGQLDDYEGVSVEAGETPLYRRDLTIVECNGESTQSWIYWYNGSTSNRPLVPSGDILQYMREKNRSL